jgi:predicted CXXCH cytochrome family protein
VEWEAKIGGKDKFVKRFNEVVRISFLNFKTVKEKTLIYWSLAMKQTKKSGLLLVIFFASILILSQCVSREVKSNDPRGGAFAGSTSCRQCHQQVCDAYVQSAHFHTTQPASRQNVLGSFKKDSNSFNFGKGIYVQMQDRDSGLYQVAFQDGKQTEAHRMDIAFGLRHAQTFLYWNGDQSFELPVSFYTSVNSWATSPGFSATQVNFNRFIGANCFECHSSYIGSQLNASTAGIQEVLDKNTLVYGIDCERCHGPALNHVNYHLDNPGEKEARFIKSMKQLTREQRLDVCAVCHSGNKKMEDRSTFKFRPGDTLSHFFVIWPGQDTASNFDVHGNQFQLLSQSRCFLVSKTLECSSCHNAHFNAGNDLKAYSSVCMGCHRDVVHDFAKDDLSKIQLQNNCIDCHMPLQPSNAISFQLSGAKEKSAYLLRNHRIAVYKKS